MTTTASGINHGRLPALLLYEDARIWLIYSDDTLRQTTKTAFSSEMTRIFEFLWGVSHAFSRFSSFPFYMQP